MKSNRIGEKLNAIQLHYDLLLIIREEIGFKDKFAEQFASAIARGLQRRLGGREIYIPAEDKHDRDEQIRKEFNGRNRDEIMKKFAISKTRLYEIVSLK